MNPPPKKLATRKTEDLAPLSDKEIIELCQKELPSDVSAYQELLRRYEGLVFQTCLKILNSPQDAEEVAQDVFIQVFHKLNTFEGRSTFKTWLYKIVHNYCYNSVSRLARRREKKNEYEKQTLHEGSKTYTDDKHNPLSERVEEALGKLKDKEKEVMVLKFMSGLTLQEMADVLELSLSAAKMRLYRAMESFKSAYQHMEQQEELTITPK